MRLSYIVGGLVYLAIVWFLPAPDKYLLEFGFFMFATVFVAIGVTIYGFIAKNPKAR